MIIISYIIHSVGFFRPGFDPVLDRKRDDRIGIQPVASFHASGTFDTYLLLSLDAA